MTFDDPGGDDENSAGRRGKRPRKERSRKEYAAREKRVPKPLDPAQLQDLAIGYAAKYATTAAKLRQYLQRKLGERGWSGEALPDTEALVGKITGLGYVDDRAYAASQARDLTARGFGARRVRGALAAAGVGRDDVSAAIDPGEDDDGADAAMATAIAFARRRRFGPFGRDGVSRDPVRMRRELAAMARAGHDFDVAKRVLAAQDEDTALGLMED
jgi:regulatory protein